MNEAGPTRLDSHIAMVLIHIMIHTLVGNGLPAKKPYGMKVNHSMQ